MVAGVFLGYWFTDRGPKYHGKSVAFWFNEPERAVGAGRFVGVSFVDKETWEAFQSMGAAAVPYLVTQLKQEDSWWIGFYWRHGPKLPGVILKRLPIPRQPYARQQRAALLLQTIGPPAQAAVPDLIAVYNRAYRKIHRLAPGLRLDWPLIFTNPPSQTRVTSAAANLYSVRLAGGALLLRGSEETLMRSTLTAMVSIGGANREIIPLMLADLRDHGFYFGNASNGTNLAPAIRNSEPTLLAALNDSTKEVRLRAVNLLGTLIPDHEEVIAPVIKVLGDGDASIRAEVLRCLGKTHLGLELVVPALCTALADKDDGIRWQAASQLGEYGSQAKSAVPALVEMLRKDESNRLRGKAAIVLGQIGPEAGAAIPALQQALHDEYSNVQTAAREALEKIGAAGGQP